MDLRTHMNEDFMIIDIEKPERKPSTLSLFTIFKICRWIGPVVIIKALKGISWPTAIRILTIINYFTGSFGYLVFLVYVYL